MKGSRQDLSLQDIILLDSADVIEQHSAMIRRFGGAPEIRDIGLLESAVGRVGSAISYSEQMDAVEAAAMLCWTVVKNHPFVDGNKRAGYGALVTMLAANGLQLDPGLTSEEVAERIVEVASGERDFKAFQDWLDPRTFEDNTYRRLFEHDNGAREQAREEDGVSSLPEPGF